MFRLARVTGLSWLGSMLVLDVGQVFVWARLLTGSGLGPSLTRKLDFF